MTHKKKTYGHQLGPTTHFLTTSKFDLLLYIGRNVQKTPSLITFSGKKRSNWKKIKKKLLQASTADHDLFFQISHIWPTFIFGVSNAPDIFFLLFLGKTGQKTRYLEKKTYGHQLGPMTHFLTTRKFDLLLYIYIINFLNLPVHALIHDLQKKNLRASTRTHDPFSDNPKIWPTFIYRGEVPADTFAKLPVHALINDPQKNWYRHQLQPMTHFFTNHKFDLLSYIYIINFLNLPVHALIHDLQKKNLRASTRTHDPFSDNPKIWPTFIYRGEVPAVTFAKLPVRALINDPQKNWYRHQLQPMTHFFTNHKFDLSYIYIINFLNLPVHALIHDLQKKPTGIN